MEEADSQDMKKLVDTVGDQIVSISLDIHGTRVI